VKLLEGIVFKKGISMDNILKEKIADMIVSFLETYKERQVVYDDLNDKIKEIQGDFYSNLEMIDHTLCNKLFDFIDFLIEEMTGSKELVCHILYDTAIIIANDISYDLKNKDELKAYLMLDKE